MIYAHLMQALTATPPLAQFNLFIFFFTGNANFVGKRRCPGINLVDKIIFFAGAVSCESILEHFEAAQSEPAPFWGRRGGSAHQSSADRGGGIEIESSLVEKKMDQSLSFVDPPRFANARMEIIGNQTPHHDNNK